MRVTTRTTILIATWVTAVCCSAPAVAEAGKDDMATQEMLILGFERRELVDKSRKFWGGSKDGNGGLAAWAWFETENADLSKPTAGNRIWTWTIRPGEATQGELSLAGQMRKPDGKPRVPFQTTELISRFYPAPCRGRQGQTSVIFSTYQWLRAAPAGLRDWSAYTKLLADVKVSVPTTIRLFIEDDLLEPPVVAAYDVKPGKWVTLELDLARAARQRKLDTTDMVNLWITANPSRDGTFKLDNIRVAKGRTASPFKVLTCDESFALPPRALPKRPVVPKRPKGLKLDRSPVTLTRPAVVDIGRGRVAPFGWITAVDNRRMFLAVGSPPRAFYTLDGGRTWKKTTPPVVQNEDHGTARGSALDADGGGAAVSSGPGCAGIGVAAPRQFMTKYTFTGAGWTARTPASIVDCDIRHCGSTLSMLRLRSGPRAGRLWAAWGQIGRRRSLAVHAKFSDDDGVTWHTWGRGGRIPGSEEDPWATNSYGYQQARLTEYRGHVACIWQDKRGLLWTFFDGKAWSPVKAIDRKAPVTLEITPSESFRVPGSAVTLGESDIFLTAWNVPGVFHWNGKRWRRELPDAADAGTLSVCGDQVMLFTTGHVPKPPRRKQIRIVRRTPILCYRRDPKGRWHGPFDLAGGKVKLPQYRQIASLVAPPIAPPNFVPVAFSDDTETVRLLKVPADISGPVPPAP